MKYWWLWLCLVVGLVACGDEADAPQRATPAEDGQTIAWQRPNQVLTAENIREIELLGILDGHTDTVFDVTFNPNGQRLATLGGDDRLIVWNLANGQSLTSIGSQTTGRAFLLADNENILTINDQNILQKWSILGGTSESFNFENQISTALLTPNGETLAIGQFTGELNLWDTESFTEEETITAFSNRGLYQVFFSADGSRAWMMDGNGNLGLWDSETWRNIQTIEENINLPLNINASPDLTHLAVVHEGTINVYNMANGSLVNTFTIPPYISIRQVEFSADNAWIALGGELDSVTIFDVATGDLVVALREHRQSFLELGFSPDRSLILTSIEGGGIFAWNLSDLINQELPSSQVEIQIPRAELNLEADIQLSRVMWSPEANYIVVADRRGPVYIYGIP